MFHPPSPPSQIEHATEWEYLNELNSMADWLGSGDEASLALSAATASMGTFGGPEMLKTWIHTLATFEIEQAGHRSEFGQYLGRFLNGGSSRLSVNRAALASEVATRLAVIEQLCCIPDNYRCALLLKEGQGMSVDQTAAVMGVSPSSLRSILYRARQAVRAS